MCFTPGVFSRSESNCAKMNFPKTNLFPKNPRSAVKNIAEMNTKPGISLAIDGMRLSMDEMMYQITKTVKPIGPIIASH